MLNKNNDSNQESLIVSDPGKKLKKISYQRLIKIPICDMSKNEIKRFCEEWERIKNKYDTDENLCVFKINTEDSKPFYMKKVILEANVNMLSAYLTEQNT